MQLPDLVKGFLVKRYKRFFVDVILETGEKTTAHCPNSGSMMNLLQEGNPVYLSKSINPKNKLPFKLEIIEVDGYLVGVNTLISNKIVKESLENKSIKILTKYDIIKPETKFNNSRFDFYLSTNNQDQEAFLEVKNITLKREQNIAEFPDAVTSRGSKHLQDLINVIKAGKQAFNLYLVQREDIKYFKIAKNIDKVYYNNFMEAKENGVIFLCYKCEISPFSINLKEEIEIIYD